MDTLFDTSRMVKVDPNPCVGLYGYGPEGKRCRTCALLLPGPTGHSKRWYKCALRRNPLTMSFGGPDTDHRMKWNACAKYMEGEGSDVDEAVS